MMLDDEHGVAEINQALENIEKKIHFDAAEAVALAGFAAAAFYVEAEPAGAIAALTRFRKHGKEIADRSEHTGISRRVRSRRATDRRLIDLDDFVDLVGTDDFAMRGGRFGGAIEFLRERTVKNVVDERGFAGAGDAGHYSKQPERKSDIDFFQIVGGRAKNLDGLPVGATAFFGHSNFRRAA